MEDNHIEAAMIMKHCLKIFWSYTVYALPGSTSVVDVNVWFTVIGQLLEKRLPENSEGIEPFGQPLDPDERRKWPWWKVRAPIIVCTTLKGNVTVRS